MPLGTKVGLGPGRIVLHGEPAVERRKSAKVFMTQALTQGKYMQIMFREISMKYGLLSKTAVQFYAFRVK